MILNMEEFSGSNDQPIAKGKRTKRPRPSSSATSSGAGARGGAEFCNSSFISSSPTTSISGISTCTEEDEDMANCLILLAHGGSPPHKEADNNNKFISRRFTEMATSSVGKVGIYVYECKTCNRTFPSFQALGGHRASHKKPKTTAIDIDRKRPPPPPPPEKEEKLPPSSHTDHNKAKLHECSICGSEFASGQALGGHMRRHRSSAPSGTTSSSHDVSDHHKKRGNMLGLDLNLPAPPEDEKYDQFPISKQRPEVVFSAAALVDCHY